MADDDYAPEALEDGDNEDKDDFKVGGLSGNHTTTRFARRFCACTCLSSSRTLLLRNLLQYEPSKHAIIALIDANPAMLEAAPEPMEEVSDMHCPTYSRAQRQANGAWRRVLPLHVQGAAARMRIGLSMRPRRARSAHCAAGCLGSRAYCLPLTRATVGCRTMTRRRAAGKRRAAS
jgi:hypothetical protein